MWFEYCPATNTFRAEGFIEKKLNATYFFCNRVVQNLTSIEQVSDLEYAQIIQLDSHNRELRFARDYLGFHPLLFSIHNKKIFISDNIKLIIGWLKQAGASIQISELSLALYFSMGYIPQGTTLIDNITTCKNATIYRFHKGMLTTNNLFRPIEQDDNHSVLDVKSIITEQTATLCEAQNNIDVWCSGGIDSTIVAYCAKLTHKDSTELLSFDYPTSLPLKYRSGELPYVEQVSQHYDLPLRLKTLSKQNYQTAYNDFISTFPMPVFDICIPPKYLLASATNHFALTGEGGDPVFSGVKNNFMLFMTQKYPNESLGWLYALSHKRFAFDLPVLFHNHRELKERVTGYFDDVFAEFPDGLTKKLFYLNTFLKQGSLIFLENYYAEQRYNVQIRHPLTSLAVYQSAFKLSNEKRYVYPEGKLALKKMFMRDLPQTIIHRKKSGTLVPMSYYLENRNYQLNDSLRNTGFFNESNLQSLAGNHSKHGDKVLLQYAIMVLNNWLTEHLGDN